MQPQTQLDILAGQFADWRATRGHNRRTPDHLAKAVLAIVDQYPINKVLRALGINNDALKRWGKQFNLRSAEPEFVEITAPRTLETAALCLEIHAGDLNLTVSGASQALANFVMQLRRGL